MTGRGLMGDRLRALRLSIPTTQVDLAAKVGVSAKRLNDYERHRLPIPLNVAMRLSEKLGRPLLDYLYLGRD